MVDKINNCPECDKPFSWIVKFALKHRNMAFRAVKRATEYDQKRLIMRRALEKIANGDGHYDTQDFEYKQIARKALIQGRLK